MMSSKELIFRTSPLLVSIDGPDGVGKSTIAKLSAIELQKFYGKEKVKLVRPSFFDTSPGARLIGEELRRLAGEIQEHSQRHNSFFLAAMETNYKEVILPTIMTGRIVVMDSSEIRALAFIADKGTQEAIEDTTTRIKTGILTCGLLPKTRIILSATTSDLWKNLCTKEALDRGDPQGFQEIQKRVIIYEKAIEFFRQLKTNRRIKWLAVNIKHQHNPNDREMYLLGIIRKWILPHLQRSLNPKMGG